MKNISYLFIIPVLFFLCAFTPLEMPLLPTIESNTSLQLGEMLTYKVHYSWVNAGFVNMKIDPQIHKVNNKDCYRISVTGESKGLLHLFIKMKNHFESYLDTASLLPQHFYRDIHENSYRKNERINFDYKTKHLLVKQLDDTGENTISKNEFDIPENLQDIVSIWYVLRNLDFINLEIGEIIYSPVFFDDVLYEKFKIKFVGRKTIKTKLGPLNTLVLAPLVPFASTEKSIFAGENSVELFLSDDENKIPVKIKINLLVGAVEIDLINCQGTKQPLKTKDGKIIKERNLRSSN